MIPRRLHSDDGTALVLALVFLSLFGLFVATILSFADTGVRTTLALRDHDARLYAVDGAVDGAMLYVRDDAVRGREGLPCPEFRMTTTNDVPVVVECQPQAGSGALLPGGGNNTNNKPEHAVLTLSQNGNEDGIFVQNLINPPLPFSIIGPVRSNSTIAVTSGSVTVEGNIRAAGACSGDIESVGTPPGTKQCDTGNPAADPGAGNSAYNPKVTTRPPDVSVPACTPVDVPVVMPPGTYTDAGALNTLMASCDRTFLFEGVYYFDFTDTTNVTCGSTSGTHLWCVQNGNANFSIIGGTPDPDAPGECLPTGPGTQWIFGGDSRVSFQAGKARVCAYPETNRQRIAIYAKAGSQPPTPPPTVFPAETKRLVAATAATPNNARFDNPDGAKTIGDNQVATATLGSDKSATVTLSGFTPTVPADATVGATSVLINHRETPLESLQEARLTITTGKNRRIEFIATANVNCTFCLNATANRRTDTITFTSSDFDQPDEINGSTVEVAYKSNRAQTGRNATPFTDLTVEVGGAELEVTYTPAPIIHPPPDPFPSQTGCVIQTGIAAITGCALVTTDGSNTDVRIEGTIYTPASAVFIKSVNRGSQIIGRGLISRVLRVELPASTGLNEPPIRIPPDSGGSNHANRDVIFTAKVDGVARLRARAEYDDANSPPTVTVDSWAVLR